MLLQRIKRTIDWLLCAIVVAVPLFYWKWSLFPYGIPKTSLFEALVELIFSLWIVLIIFDRRYRPRMTPLAWAVCAYLAILVITAFTGVDPWRSFFSDLTRNFGIVAYLHLAALALVVSSLGKEISWKKLWYVSFGTTLVTVAIAAIQLRVSDFLLANDLGGGRPGSTFGNATFFAGYLLFNIFIAAYYLFREKDPAGKWLVWATVVGGIIGIFITETRGDIFGLFAGILALVIFFAFHPPVGLTEKRSRFSRRSFYILLLAILIIVAAGVWATRSDSIWNGVPGIDRLKDLTLSGTDSDIVPRLIASQAAWQGFVARPFTGWGFENFNVVFNAYYNPKVLEYGYAESNFDKPHDIVLEMLDAGGILLLLAYLGVLAAALYEAWRLKDRLAGQVVAAAIVAYFLRSLVIFDTIGPALMLYLLFGWVDGEYRVAVVTSAPKNNKTNDSQIIVLIMALIIAVIVMYALNETAMAAGYSAWEGHEDIQLAGQPAAGAAAFAADAGTWNVYQWDYIRDYATTIAEAYASEPTAFSTSTIVTAVTAMEQVTLDHPNDASNHYSLANIYNLMYAIDPQDYLIKAQAQEQAALQLSPNRQEIFYDIIKTQSLEGNNAAALAAAKEALNLDPNIANSHFYYGILAFATGDNTTGYTEIETAIKMGRPWSSYNEPEIVADYFANSGHISEAIQLYKEALQLNPADTNAQTKLDALDSSTILQNP